MVEFGLLLEFSNDCVMLVKQINRDLRDSRRFVTRQHDYRVERNETVYIMQIAE